LEASAIIVVADNAHNSSVNNCAHIMMDNPQSELAQPDPTNNDNMSINSFSMGTTTPVLRRSKRNIANAFTSADNGDSVASRSHRSKLSRPSDNGDSVASLRSHRSKLSRSSSRRGKNRSKRMKMTHL
jgi:hypothetical protein